MESKRSHTVILIITLSFLALLFACSPAVQYNVMSTLFDDVPDPNKNQLTVGVDTLGQLDTARVIAIAKAEPISKFIYHLPYQQKDCEACHDQNSMGKLVDTEP